MKIINSYDGFAPNLSGEDVTFLAVLTQDEASKFAVYCGVVSMKLPREVAAFKVAYSGQKLTWQKAVMFFPAITEQEYRR